MPKGLGIPYDEAVPMVADALAYYDETDVRRWFERNQQMTGRYPTIYRSTIEDLRTFRKVPNEPFRKAWLAQPASRETTPEWCGLFRDELQRVITLPEALDFPPSKIGPKDLSHQRISDYLRSALGITASNGRGGITLAWLLQYEVAEALCKTLGLVPIQVGI